MSRPTNIYDELCALMESLDCTYKEMDTSEGNGLLFIRTPEGDVWRVEVRLQEQEPC